MAFVAAAPIWWFWIGVFLFIPGILLVLGLIGGYLYNVVRPKYQKR